MGVPKRSPKGTQKVPREARGPQKQFQCSHATAVACGMMPRYAHATQPMAAALVLLPPRNAKMLQNGPRMKSMGSYFLEKMWKWKNVFGLRRRVRIAYEPIPWSAQGDQKIKKTTTYFRTALFSKTTGNIKKKASKRCPKVVVYFGGGASWGTFGAAS